MNVSIEYTMERNMVLDNVNIMIPLGSHDAPHVASVDGQYQHNSAEGSLLWHQDRVDSAYVCFCCWVDIAFIIQCSLVCLPHP